MKSKTKSPSPKPTTPTPPTAPPAFAPLQEHCACYRGELTLLKHSVSKLEFALAQARAEFMPRIAQRAEAIQYPRNRVWAFIVSNNPLFDSPRTRIFSDIKVGLQKQKGQTVIADPDKTIALIAKHFPERLDELAPATRAISKTALASLPASDLKKIAVEITADTDGILIKPQDSDVEKAVAALLKDSTPA